MSGNRLLALAAGLVLALRALLPGEPAGWRERTPLPIAGTATYYAPAVMDAVLAYRLRAGDVQPCNECVGTVALLRAGDIGRRVWLEHGGAVLGPFLVVDCATAWDYERLVGTDWVADVSFATAALWGSLGGGTPVRVLERAPVLHGAHNGEER